jgi:xanthine dehydrogenase molybdenum-binding subunit
VVQLNEPPAALTPSYAVVGTRPIRHDGVDKVTGRARYANDIDVPGRIFGKLLRSPHAHARILSIDTSRAEKLPGVRAVVTAADFPDVSGRLTDQPEGAYHNIGFLSRNSMAREKALYRGHAVAAVAADSAHLAEEALALIDVQYEVLPPVLDGLEAMAEGAPVVLEDLKPNSNPFFRAGGFRSEDEPRYQSNVANTFAMGIGDLANGFELADIVLEHDYRTGAAHQGYIEPQSATAHWSPDGLLTIWCTTQGQFAIRDYTAAVLDIPPGNVRVVPSEIGGGFGAKTFTTIEPVAAVLSRKAGRPVKVTISRTEVFEAMGPTSATHIHLKMGVTNEGRLTAAEARLVYEAGAFPGSPVTPGAMCMFAPYDIPNAKVEGFDVLVNKPKASAYRAPGSPAASFAVESMIDEFCERLGMDPIEFRLLNTAPEGARRVTGAPSPKLGFEETLQAARETAHYRSRLEGRWRGRGVAGGFWFNGGGPATAIASVLPDGRVSLVEGSPDIGGTRTVAAMQFAEVLGIPVEDVRPSVADTDSVGYTSTTGGSSVAFKTGWAAYEAAQDVRRQAIDRAAKIWQMEPDDVVFERGHFSNRRDDRTMTFRELAGRLNETGGPITGRAALNPRGVGGAYAFHIADVEVDPETGKVQVLRYTALQDAGRAIHPGYVEGQMQGGAAQGIGWALNEEYVYNAEGRMVNSSFLDYRMPTALDLPMIETVIVEVPNPGHPFGVRGVGEVPIVPPLAAIANAVAHATGARFYSVPITPGRLLEALAHAPTP